MQLKYWIIIGIVMVAVALVIWWHSPTSGLKQTVTAQVPDVRLAAVDIKEINPESVQLVTHVVLNNKLPVELNTKSIDYEVYVGSVKVIQNSYTRPFTIHSSDSTVIELPMEILAGPIKRMVDYFDQNKIDSADYTLKFNVLLDVPVAGETNFDMQVTRRLPAVRIPKVKLEEVDIDKLGMKDSRLDVVVNIENPNLFPLKMKDGRYSMTIDDNLAIEGFYDKIVNIPPKSTESIGTQLDIQTAKVGSLAWKTLFEKEDTRFTFNFSFEVISNSEILENSSMSLNAKGTLADLLDSNQEH